MKIQSKHENESKREKSAKTLRSLVKEEEEEQDNSFEEAMQKVWNPEK